MRPPLLSTVAMFLTMTAAQAGAQVLRLATENDILTKRGPRDDLYTFSVAIEIEGSGFEGSVRENAFTDRSAGKRFDETYLSIRRPIPVDVPWQLVAELGVVHVGEGLFGERAQNAVHRAVGGEEVELEYTDSSVHPRVAFTAAPRLRDGDRFRWGPRLDVDVVPGLRSWALISAEAAWLPTARIAVELQGGGRFTRVSYAPLEPHLASSAFAGRASVVFDDRYFISWSYNDYGDEREHVSAGYRLPLGRRGDGLR